MRRLRYFVIVGIKIFDLIFQDKLKGHIRSKVEMDLFDVYSVVSFVACTRACVRYPRRKLDSG